MTILTISGSPSANSRSTKLLDHIASRLQRQGVLTQELVVRDLPAEDILFGRFDSASIRAAGEQIDRASGIVIATPIYKAAASGVLKAFLDLLGQNALAGKVILPIGIGGSPAHLLAIDYSLRPVLAALGATQVLSSVYAIDKQVHVDKAERVLDDEIELRVEDSLLQLISAVYPDGAERLRRATRPAAGNGLPVARESISAPA